MRKCQYEKSVMTSYVKRRRKKEEELNADEIWSRILTDWPTLTDEEREAIFQDCDGGSHVKN